MRIIAGDFRRRRLLAPDGLVTRPIPDRVKESLFGMLGERVKGAAVLDLFAGTGSIGLEAVSRGAASCMLVERDREVARVLQTNIDTLGAQSRCKVVLGDALGQSIVARAPRPLDLVFLDPPYPVVRVAAGWNRVRQQAAALAALLADDGFLILRTPWPFLLDPEPLPGAAEEAARFRRERKPRDENEAGRGRWRDEAAFARERERARRHSPPGAPDVPDGPEAILNLRGHDGADESVETDDAIAASTGIKGPPADLSLAGCKGPETHAYGSTAVHWYMRAR